ncbi:MAG: hypothetical protein DKT66_03600 [Candidatus Melainabacteria bacterium]|nr:MAG: hypothetical protein DKT66_03600 [Candidatus Melainabacteria bacterium]
MNKAAYETSASIEETTAKAGSRESIVRSLREKICKFYLLVRRKRTKGSNSEIKPESAAQLPLSFANKKLM